MSEVELNGAPKFKSKSKPKEKLEVKPTENQQQIDLEAKEFEAELKKQRKELKTEATKETDIAPLQETELVEGELVNPAQRFTLTADELSKIICAAQGGEMDAHLALRMPEDLAGVEKVGYVVDDALGEVGRGLHRVADGARDIVGGAIDILTLGRANRK